MKPQYDIVLVMPVGPRCNPAFIVDSLNSFMHYTWCSYKILLADDSQKGTGRIVQEQIPEAEVLSTSVPMGKEGGLYVTLSLAFRYALSHYRFQAVLRMDTDALVIGPCPEVEAMEYFRNHPRAGIAGQYPLDYNGNPWDISYPKQQLLYYTSGRHKRHKTFARLLLWMLYKMALRKGYRTGESVFGGAYFISAACLRALKNRGLLPLYPLKTLSFEEDHLFSLLTRSVGFELGDLSSGWKPMGCAWKGLPASPSELYDHGKKIIHSTRSWKDMKEEDIRSFFLRKRLKREELDFTKN